jgi:hypothetical protein
VRGKNRIGYGIGVISLGLAMLFGAPAVPALEAWLGLLVSVGIVAVLVGLTLIAVGGVVFLRDRAAARAVPASEQPAGSRPEAAAQWIRKQETPGVVTFTNTGRPADVHFIRPWSSYSTVDTDFSLPIRLDTGAAITVRYTAPEPDHIKLQWRTPPGGLFEDHSFSVLATTTP